MAEATLCVSYPCYDLLCSIPEHNLPFYNCTPQEFSARLDGFSKFRDAYSTHVSFSLVSHDRFDHLGTLGPGPECDIN